MHPEATVRLVSQRPTYQSRCILVRGTYLVRARVTKERPNKLEDIHRDEGDHGSHGQAHAYMLYAADGKRPHYSVSYTMSVAASAA